MVGQASHIARFRKDLPYRPHRLAEVLAPLLTDLDRQKPARAWLRGDRLSVLPCLRAPLSEDLLSWCELGLHGGDFEVEELLTLAEELEPGALVVYDTRPGRGNAVHIPLGSRREFERFHDTSGPWFRSGETAQISYEEGYAGLREGPPPSTVARRRRAATWARDRFLAGRCPSPEAVRAKGEAGREARGGASAALPIPPQGLVELRPLLRAWLGLVEERSRIDLLWAAPHEELRERLEGHLLRRTAQGRRWYGVCSLSGRCPAPSQGAVWDLLCTLGDTTVGGEILAGSFRFDMAPAGSWWCREEGGGRWTGAARVPILK